MRIALFHNLGAGGAKRHLHEQVRTLHARGHRLSLFIPAEANETFLPLSAFCETVRIFGDAPPTSSQAYTASTTVATSQSLLRHLLRTPLLLPLTETLWVARQRRRLAALARTHAEIARAIDASGCDVAYIAQDRQFMAPEVVCQIRATPTVLCCNDTPRPLVEWPAEPEPGYDRAVSTPLRRKRLGRFLNPALLRFSDREIERFETNTRAAGLVLANSFYSRECLARVTGVDARVCYCGVDSAFFTPDRSAPCERTVVSVGSLLPVKRHGFVIRAVATLPAAARPTVEIVGHESRAPGQVSDGGEGARLESLADDLGVALTIRREVSDEILRDTYRRAGVVASAPYLEPFGLVALEAAACGTPVVGVREGGVRETVVDGETGYLTDRDPAAFAAALAHILDHPDRARCMGEKARARVVADWTWERSADALETHFADTIAAQGTT